MERNIDMNVLKKQFFINIILICYVTCEYIYFLYSETFFLKFIELQLVMVFFFSIVSTYLITKRWLDIYIMFLAMFFLFLVVRPFMHLFNFVNVINYGETAWFRVRKGFVFSEYTMIKINFILLFSLLFMNLGYIVGLKKFNITGKSLFVPKSKYLTKQIGYAFFAIGLVAFLGKVYSYVHVLKAYGYFYLYSGDYTLPIWIRVFDDFFYIGYLIIMINKPSKKEGYALSIIFIVLYATMLLTGMRGEFFTLVFAVIWLLAFLYDWRPKLVYLILSGIGLMLLAQLTLAVKFSYVDFSNLSFFDMINTFLYSQGVSILILGYFIEFADHFVNIYSGFRYIISPFVTVFYTLTGQMGNRTEMSPSDIYSVGDQLEFFTDPNGYYMGAGTGSSFIAELYGLGGDVFLVAIGSFLLTFFMAYLVKRLVYKQYGFFLTMVILPIFFWIPRASYLQPIQKLLFGYILLYGFVFVKNLLVGEREEA